MLNMLPTRNCPQIRVLLENIGNPSPKRVAKALGVNERTVYRWIAADAAPKPALYALFWLTHWGRNWIHTEAHNDAIMQAGIARCLREEVAKLTERLRVLGQTGDFGSANDPAEGAVTGSPARQLSLSTAVVQGAVGTPKGLGKAHRRLEQRQRRIERRREREAKRRALQEAQSDQAQARERRTA